MSAAIATAAAIRARPMVAVMVSSLVVIFAMVELLILPFVAAAFLSHEPMVAAAWMGLAVKTDGAAVASGAITEALIYAEAAARGVTYDKGWMVGTTTTVKIFIDIFIGVWAFILAWTRHIEPRRNGDRLRTAEIWERFPKFVLGFVANRGCLRGLSEAVKRCHERSQCVSADFLSPDFLCDRTDGRSEKFSAGIGRLAAVYVICLFGFIIWVGLIISWVFFHGVQPPIASG